MEINQRIDMLGELKLDGIMGAAIEPMNALTQEVTKLAVMVNALLSTFSAEDQELILAEYNRRLSAVHLSAQKSSGTGI